MIIIEFSNLKKNLKINIIIINGGFKNTYKNSYLKKIVDGVMIGREAYKSPWIFNKDFTYDNIEGKKKLYILMLIS